MGHAVFGSDILDEAARCGNGTSGRNGSKNIGMKLPFLIFAGRIDANITRPARRKESPFEKVQLAARTGKLAGSDRFSIFLSHEVKLDTAIDTNEV